jgi:hypothetical protein
MAQYKYHQFLQQKDIAAYDVLLDPGVQAPDAGIYRFRACGHEIGIAKKQHCDRRTITNTLAESARLDGNWPSSHRHAPSHFTVRIVS